MGQESFIRIKMHDGTNVFATNSAEMIDTGDSLEETYFRKALLHFLLNCSL